LISHTPQQSRCWSAATTDVVRARRPRPSRETRARDDDKRGWRYIQSSISAAGVSSMQFRSRRRGDANTTFRHVWHTHALSSVQHAYFLSAPSTIEYKYISRRTSTGSIDRLPGYIVPVSSHRNGCGNGWAFSSPRSASNCPQCAFGVRISKPTTLGRHRMAIS
jgi:hypothetical protein